MLKNWSRGSFWDGILSSFSWYRKWRGGRWESWAVIGNAISRYWILVEEATDEKDVLLQTPSGRVVGRMVLVGVEEYPR